MTVTEQKEKVPKLTHNIVARVRFRGQNVYIGTRLRVLKSKLPLSF